MNVFMLLKKTFLISSYLAIELHMMRRRNYLACPGHRQRRPMNLSIITQLGGQPV